jgi:hypothetical protein
MEETKWMVMVMVTMVKKRVRRRRDRGVASPP